MRGGLTILAALLLVPLTHAAPLVGGPAVFVYEEIDRIGMNFGASTQEMCYTPGKVGMVIASSGPDYRFIVREEPGPFTSVLDLPPGSSSTPACIFDALGRFHAFYVVQERYVMTARFDGSTWSQAQVASTGYARAPRTAFNDGEAYFSVLVNEANFSGIYTHPRIYQLDLATDEWVIADNNMPAFLKASYRFDVDSQGRFHLLWDREVTMPGHTSARHRQYSVGDGGVWTTVDAPYGNGDQSGWGLTIGPGDKPYFAWGDSQRRPHVYAPVGPGGAYVDERPMQGGLFAEEGSGHQHTIKVDDSGRVHYHHYWTTLNFALPTGAYYYYSYRDIAGTWATTPILPGVIHFSGDMTLDGCGNPVIGVSHSRTPLVVSDSNLMPANRIGSVLIARPVEAHACGVA